MGTIGTHEVYKTYEKEFLLKASPSVLKLYNDQKNHTVLKPVMDYVEKLFKTFKFDSTFKAEEWWNISTSAVNILSKLQMDLWSSVEKRVNNIYEDEKTARNQTLVFLIVAIVLVAAFVTYNIRVITLMLTELKIAARKISLGGTNLTLKNVPNDVIGSLANSILEIDENNKRLAYAADAIGKGNFEVAIQPRSPHDLLGNSIEKMKEELHQFTLQKDKLQQETLELLNKKDEFINVVSHELKTPVTSLKVYTQILHNETVSAGDKKKENMLTRMEAQVDKLSSLINDLLDTSKIHEGQLSYNKQTFILNELVQEVVEDIQGTTSAKKIRTESNTSFKVYADRE
jgi:signal transduction histidine kinase